MSLVFIEEVLEMSPYKSLTTPSLCTPDKWQFESLPTKDRNQGGFHFLHRWDFTKPAKFSKSNIHFTLKAVHRKGTSLQCQVSDESWNKHLPKGNTPANQLIHSNCSTVAFTVPQPTTEPSECSGLTFAAQDEGSRCQVMEERGGAQKGQSRASWCEVKQ